MKLLAGITAGLALAFTPDAAWSTDVLTRVIIQSDPAQGQLNNTSTVLGAPVSLSTAGGLMDGTATTGATYLRAVASATFRNSPGFSGPSPLQNNTPGPNNSAFFANVISSATAASVFTPSQTATVDFNVLMRSNTATADNMPRARRLAGLLRPTNLPSANGVSTGGIGLPALSVNSFAQLRLTLQDLTSGDFNILEATHYSQFYWNYIFNYDTPNVPGFTQNSFNSAAYYAVNGSYFDRGGFILPGMRASGRYTLPSITLQAGRQYILGMQLECYSAAYRDTLLTTADFTGLSGFCNAGRSAYLGGISNVIGEDGNPLSGLALLGSDGTDFALPSSELPADFRIGYAGFNTAVPEPATWAMLIIGFGLVGIAARRRPHRVLA